MSDVTPFKIDIPVEQLTDLKLRLAMTRMPDAETPGDWSQGVPLAYMIEVKDYWEKSYHWPDRQTRLNRWPGFKTTLSEVDIHFLHIRSKHDDARPLLMTHGDRKSVV